MTYTCIYFLLQMLMNARAPLARTEDLAQTRLTSITAPVFLVMKERIVKLVSIVYILKSILSLNSNTLMLPLN